MGVCLVTCGKSHYSGLCDFGAITHYTTTAAYAHLRDYARGYQLKYIGSL